MKTHQSEGKEEDEQDATGEHGQTQQEHQRLILADAGELAIQCLIFQLLFIQQVLPLRWHSSLFSRRHSRSQQGAPKKPDYAS